jgi:hypothetical protein
LIEYTFEQVARRTEAVLATLQAFLREPCARAVRARHTTRAARMN